MAAFYVQMKNAKYIHFQEALNGQASIPAILRAPLEEKEEEVNVIISLSNENQSDKAGIVLHSKYDAAYNEAVNTHLLPLPHKEAADYAERQQAFIDGYKKALPDDKKWASRCQDCEVCLSKCPQQIRIPNQMARIVETLRKR